jgi:hypothetical protein
VGYLNTGTSCPGKYRLLDAVAITVVRSGRDFGTAITDSRPGHLPRYQEWQVYFLAHSQQVSDNCSSIGDGPNTDIGRKKRKILNRLKLQPSSGWMLVHLRSFANLSTVPGDLQVLTGWD